jgi:hypothetical protein
MASGLRAGDVLVKELREMRVKVGASGMRILRLGGAGLMMIWFWLRLWLVGGRGGGSRGFGGRGGWGVRFE